MKQLLFILNLCLSLSILCLDDAAAIPKHLKAKSEYILAGKLVGEGDYKNAIEHLNNAKILLNKTNGKIQYLLTKSYFETHDFSNAQKELEVYFDVIPESASSSDQYNEMVVLISEIEAKINAETALQADIMTLKGNRFKLYNKESSKDGYISITEIYRTEEDGVIGFELTEIYTNGKIYKGTVYFKSKKKNIKSIQIENKRKIRIDTHNRIFGYCKSIDDCELKSKATTVTTVNDNDFILLLRKFKSIYDY